MRVWSASCSQHGNPLSLHPSTHECIELDLETVIESVKSLQAYDGILTKKLALRGTIRFQGKLIDNANDF